MTRNVICIMVLEMMLYFEKGRMCLEPIDVSSLKDFLVLLLCDT